MRYQRRRYLQVGHRLERVSDPYMLLQEFDAYTIDQQVLRYVAATPQQLRFVRVETVSSCSWVAWREIEVYATGN
jgi:hypothetical protein